MMLYTAILIMTFCVLALILRPLLTPPDGNNGRAQSEADCHLHVYKHQLQTLNEDRLAGRISQKAANAMENEIRRNLLAAARFSDPVMNTNTLKSPKALALTIAVLSGGAAIALYTTLGTPLLPDLPLVARNDIGPSQPDMPPEMLAAITQLEDRLKEGADTAEGWYVLGRAKQSSGQMVEAIAAFRQALRLAPDAWQIKGDLAASLTQISGGQIGPEAEHLFAEVLKSEPREPRARYFLGIAKAQSGDLGQAIAIWRALEADSTPDAPWMPALKASITSAAQDLGVSPESIALESITPENIVPEAIDTAGTDDQNAMIRAMVDGLARRLEANPDNLDGWLRLAKSYHVLGEEEQARAALHRAKSIDAHSPALVQMAEDLGYSLAVPGEP